MMRSDIDRLLDEQKKHGQLFGDQFDQIYGPANEANRNLQPERDQPKSAH